jgi:hypothetical protein
MFGIPDGERLRLRITLCRPGCPPETLNHYYVASTKPAGGTAVRVLFPERFELDEHDTLIFDFTTERVG